MADIKAYTLPKLEYDYAALEPIYAREMLELHHDKHHAAYVAGANRAVENLAEARDTHDYATINQLQKDLAFNLSGHVLHSLFWRNMSPKGGGDPKGPLASTIKTSLGGGGIGLKAVAIHDGEQVGETEARGTERRLPHRAFVGFAIPCDDDHSVGLPPDPGG